MRITTANVNGIRSASTKGFVDWLAREAPDVVCLQETRAPVELFDAMPALVPAGWHAVHRAAETRGYSGVSIYARRPPDAVIERIGWAPFDAEARYVEARFGDLSVVSLYVPSGSSGEARQAFKFEAMAALRPILAKWRRARRDYVVCGDFNIVRGERDIRNWKSNQKNSGCLPEERAWMNALIDEDGWIDAFRELKPDAVEYTWWSNRGNARANDVGWRIDYHLVSPRLRPALRAVSIYRDERFSDHAPQTLELAG
jgi:exodeoxyribonuclease-3